MPPPTPTATVTFPPSGPPPECSRLAAYAQHFRAPSCFPGTSGQALAEQISSVGVNRDVSVCPTADSHVGPFQFEAQMAQIIVNTAV